MISRRIFLKYSASGTMLTIFGLDRLTGGMKALAQIPGGTLDPLNIPKYQTPLFIPPVMPRAKVIWGGGKLIDYYEISMRQFQQQILPVSLPMTTVWGYGAVKAERENGLLIHHAPSLTIEADYNRPVRVKWINELKDENCNFLPHLLPVDPTLHWANPPGGVDGRDDRPTFTSTPGRYTGPVPIVTHLHGAVGVGDESDGYSEAWYLPDANNIPGDYATIGTWYKFFKNKAAARFGAQWGPGFAIFQYPNASRASTDWYHDHTLGITRLNVYAGPVGFYLLRGGPEGDKAVLDSRLCGDKDKNICKQAVLPGPAPKEKDKFPSDITYFEIPIAIQDRSFNTDGSLFYPDTRTFFDGITGPFIPFTDVSPIYNPEFFGNCMMVNGNTWPFHTVEQRRYRFRILNGCNSRFLILDFNNIPSVEVWQIGNEGGFLAAPVNITALGNQMLLAPAERADVIVDFTNVPVGNYVLGNVGPDAPFGGGVPGVDFAVSDPASTGQVMEFRVVPAMETDRTTPPQFLVLPAITPLPDETVTRPLALTEAASTFFANSPVHTNLGIVNGDPNTGLGVWQALNWEDEVTENPAVGATEVWEFYNSTADAHPIHIHEISFEVVNRQDITVDATTQQFQVVPGSTPAQPEPWETGFKDTVIVYPNQVTRVRAQFNFPGQFVWHCHMLEHEDNEMMRPYRIGPVQPGQPS